MAKLAYIYICSPEFLTWDSESAILVSVQSDVIRS